MDSTINDRLKLLEAESKLREAETAVLRNDLYSLKRQVVKLIVMVNEMNYEQKMGSRVRLRTGDGNPED
jgi:predicted AlkP superfamily phosphohydrolase/phosphomutase